MNVYVDFYKDGRVMMDAELWLGEQCITNEDVPLKLTEKVVLWNAFLEYITSRGTTLEETFVKAEE
jgi:hypothetical protein